MPFDAGYITLIVPVMFILIMIALIILFIKDKRDR
jgi:hypothetical protein